MTVCEKDQCAGCMACADICPTQSIDIIDSLRSLNAEINTSTCINCNLCHDVCQQNHPATLRDQISWYQGWANEKIRSTSSSGGFGQEVMKTFINHGGLVAACKLIQDNV